MNESQHSIVFSLCDVNYKHKVQIFQNYLIHLHYITTEKEADGIQKKSRRREEKRQQ